MDEIIIKGLKAFACQATSAEEKGEGQLFLIDIVAKADLKSVYVSEKSENTICYANMIRTIKDVVAKETNYYIESFAERIAKAILTDYEILQSVKVKIKKPNAPITANFEYVGISIERGRDDILG